MARLLFLIFLLHSECVFCQAAVQDRIDLKRRHSSKNLNRFKDITIFSIIRADSSYNEVALQRHNGLRRNGDLIIGNALQTYSCVYRNGIPRSTRVTTFSDTSKNIFSFPINEIQKISIVRPAVRIPTGIVASLSLVSALLVAPAVSIRKDFDTKKYKEVVAYSLGVFALAATVSIIWSSKTFHLKSKRTRRNWTIN